MKIKPTLREGAYYDIQSALVEALEKTCIQNGLLRSCCNCLNFKEQVELCKLYNQRPPARVIAYGCPKWEDKDELPF